MKISVIRTIGKNKTLPSQYRLANPSSDRMSEPVKLHLREFKFIRQRKIKNDAEAEALRKGLLWVFRNLIVRVEEADGASRAEIVTRIKHKVLSEEKAFAKMARIVDLFEKMEKEPVRRRLPIADEVRVLVWRRDERGSSQGEAPD